MSEFSTILRGIPVLVTYTPGHYTPAKLSGHPDSWAPEEGESPEILAVQAEEGEGEEIPLNSLTNEELKRLADRAWYAQEEAERDHYEEPLDYDPGELD